MRRLTPLPLMASDAGVSSYTAILFPFSSLFVQIAPLSLQVCHITIRIMRHDPALAMPQKLINASLHYHALYAGNSSDNRCSSYEKVDVLRRE